MISMYRLKLIQIKMSRAKLCICPFGIGNHARISANLMAIFDRFSCMHAILTIISTENAFLFRANTFEIPSNRVKIIM